MATQKNKVKFNIANAFYALLMCFLNQSYLQGNRAWMLTGIEMQTKAGNQ